MECPTCGHPAAAPHEHEFEYDAPGAIDEELLDPITQQPFFEPKHLPCGHTFSSASITTALRAKRECPLCRRPARPEELKDAVLMIRNILDKLKVKCPYPPCPAITPRGDLPIHLPRCPKARTTCPEGCRAALVREAVAEHLAVCPSVRVPCPHEGCPTAWPRAAHAAHVAECAWRPVLCPDGCGAQLSHRDIATHSDECPNVFVVCELPHIDALLPDLCGQRLARRHLAGHLIECPNRPVTCPGCHQAFSFRDTELHPQSCPMVEIACQHGCGDRHLRLHSVQHTKICPGVPVPCGNTYEGEVCRDQPLRRDLEQHRTAECPLRVVMCDRGCGARACAIAIATHSCVAVLAGELVRQREEHQQTVSATATRIAELTVLLNEKDAAIARSYAIVAQLRAAMTERDAAIAAQAYRTKFTFVTPPLGDWGKPRCTGKPALSQLLPSPNFCLPAADLDAMQGYNFIVSVSARMVTETGQPGIGFYLKLVESPLDHILDWPLPYNVRFHFLGEGRHVIRTNDIILHNRKTSPFTQPDSRGEPKGWGWTLPAAKLMEEGIVVHNRVTFTIEFQPWTAAERQVSRRVSAERPGL
eukprot:m.190613 g.190613  ORF g.190613 m.190613 type:complete len:588 (+) comp10044_c0_seq6:91-1854(+)